MASWARSILRAVCVEPPRLGVGAPLPGRAPPPPLGPGLAARGSGTGSPPLLAWVPLLLGGLPRPS
eukprot:2069183-Alexandrium_andersonii.AAC.1